MASRPIYVYEVPESLAAASGGIKSIGMVELTAREELLATKLAKNDAMRLAFELAKASLVQVNGAAVSAMPDEKSGESSADEVWLRMHPKLRSLVLQAYNELHNPSNEESSGFLKSRVVRAG